MKTQSEILNGIEHGLDYRTPIPDLIKKLTVLASNADLREQRGHDLARCLMHNAASRLELLYRRIDVRPWATWRERLRDAWAVLHGRALAVYVSGTVYDDWKKPDVPAEPEPEEEGGAFTGNGTRIKPMWD